MQRALLGGKVETGEDDDAVETICTPQPGAALHRERRTPVRPHARLDRVEHVGESHGLAAADDLDLDALELGDRPHQLRRERRQLPGHHAALRKPSRAETSAAAAAQSSPSSGSRDSSQTIGGARDRDGRDTGAGRVEDRRRDRMEAELELLDRDGEAGAPGSFELRSELSAVDDRPRRQPREPARAWSVAEGEQRLAVRGRMEGRGAAGPVRHADEVRRVDLEDVQRPVAVANGEVDRLTCLLRQPFERRPSGSRQRKAPDRQRAESRQLGPGRKALALPAHEPAALERGQQAGDGALVHPELGGELGDAEVRPALVEGREDRQRPVRRLHRCVFCNGVAFCATFPT